jgi:hypothetical protein
MAKIDDGQKEQMVYNPPPVNPPSPPSRAYAAIGLIAAAAAFAAFESGRLELAEALGVIGQIFAGLSAVVMVYSGPPINPPGPTPRREAWLLVLAIAALGVALLGARGSVLGFAGPAGVAVVAYALFLGLGWRGGRVAAARGQQT